MTAAADSIWELDSVEVVLAVGCTTLSGTPPDDGRLPPKFSPPKPVRRSEVVSAEEEDAVGETMSSLLGIPTEGCCEGLELGAVGETMSSLLGIPTEGCCEELSLEVDGTSEEEDVATLELEKVGCGSLLGTGPTDGCCPSLLPDLVLLLEVESGLDDDDSEELEKVGCTKKSGSPLEGVGITVASSVLASYSSLLEVVGIVSEEELLKVGWTISSLLGSPADGCVDAGVVDSGVLSGVAVASSSDSLSSSSVELAELVVSACELEVVVARG